MKICSVCRERYFSDRFCVATEGTCCVCGATHGCGEVADDELKPGLFVYKQIKSATRKIPVFVKKDDKESKLVDRIEICEKLGTSVPQIRYF